MAQPLFRQLLNQARRLARLDPRRPQQANLRRAVSGAYYALFHFLIDEANRLLLGTTPGHAGLRNLTARAFVHAEMAAASRTFAGGTLPATIVRQVGTLTIPAPLRELAEQFSLTQDRRHLADYDRVTRFSRVEVLLLIDGVELALAGWGSVRNDAAAKLFLLALLLWTRIRDK